MTIDGLTAARIIQPESVQELSEYLSTESESVVPVGGSTQQEFGNPLKRFHCALDLTRLNRVSEYVPADLTIHVQAGVRLGDLQRLLRENHQFLPLDPWNGPSATIGGIAAANAQGPYRATGTIRDWIIGMTVVEVSGKVSKAGGRVVKNVTGYDLAKLYTGSIGTLAVISEISLKLRASFGKTATAIARFAGVKEAAAALAVIRTGSLAPVSCEWVGPQNEVWLRFGEHPRAVEWQLKNLPAADWRIVEDVEESSAWETLRNRYSALAPITLKVIGTPVTVVDIVNEFQPSAWIVHALNGIVLMAVPAVEDVARVRQKYRAVVERASLEARQRIRTFGLTAAEMELMLKMKRAFDPDGRLNPGRHVDGEANAEN